MFSHDSRTIFPSIRIWVPFETSFSMTSLILALKLRTYVKYALAAYSVPSGIVGTRGPLTLKNVR